MLITKEYLKGEHFEKIVFKWKYWRDTIYVRL